MEQYGDFIEVINQMESRLHNVKEVWNDQTGLTYDSINENMQLLARRIWQFYINSFEQRKSVKEQYNEAEFETEVNILNSKVSDI